MSRPTLEQVARRGGRAGRRLVVMLVGSDAAHERTERYATGGQPDGVLFASIHGADPLPERLARNGVSVVCNGRPLGSGTCWRAGRRRIATIAGPQDMVAGVDRLDAYRQTLAALRRPGPGRGVASDLMAHGALRTICVGRTYRNLSTSRDPARRSVDASHCHRSNRRCQPVVPAPIPRHPLLHRQGNRVTLL